MSKPVAIEFLSPTDKDDFKEEVLGKDKFRITYKDGEQVSFLIVEIEREKVLGYGMTMIDGTFTEHGMKKLVGYVMFKIITRYERK